jgi:gamma-glutamyltranspeptidase/glutathione hydrolase
VDEAHPAPGIALAPETRKLQVLKLLEESQRVPLHHSDLQGAFAMTVSQPVPRPLQKPLSVLLLCTLAAPALFAQQKPAQPNARFDPMAHGMVVTIEHNASDAGLEILKQGGNAVDAAVAVGFALAVVLPQAGNLGGGGFMLIRMNGPEKDGAGKGKSAQTHFLDFREKAPAAATATMYQDAQGNVVKGLSTLGYKAIGVPGSVAGLAYAQTHFGRLTLAQDMAPAIRFATDGYALSAEECRSLHASNITKFPESHRIFQRDGNYYVAGDIFKQPELAATLRKLAANPQAFYHGPMARQLADDVHSHGGLLTEADLANYTVVDRKPLEGDYTANGKTYEVITSPPPSSGGIVLLETLNILSGFDLPKLGGTPTPDRSPAQVQIITEAFRRAYMDRADYLGDPDFNKLPLAQMASPAYAAAWRKSIVPGKPSPSATLVRPAGFLPPPPAGAPGPKESTQTTQFSVVDGDGNAVSTTYTLNGLFGCGVTAQGLGFLLNNEMDDFSSKAGVPNMFGLVQSSANAIGPGHRPLSSMTPTIVVTKATPGHPEKLRLVLGSPGGSTIITTVANDLLSTLVNGLTVQQAADAPRFHHQYLPDVLDVEKAFPLDVVAAMRAMGYTVSRANEADEKNPGVWGDSELIAVDPATGMLVGGHDDRHSFGSIAQY